MRILLSWLATAVVALATGCDDEEGGSVAFGAYPANLCVGEKQEAAATFCAAVFDSWASSPFEGDLAQRNAAIAKARVALRGAWSAAEARAAESGADCADLALGANEAAGALVVGIEGIVTGVSATRACGAARLEALGIACRDTLVAESTHIRSLSIDSEGLALAKEREAAFDRLVDSYSQTSEEGCTGTAEEVIVELDALAGMLVRDTIVTPGLDDTGYTGIAPGPTDYLGRTYTPQCVQGSDYRYFARRGETNKLLIYYQGGGACWNALTCGIPTCRAFPNDDLAEFAADGFFNLENDRNPFRNWSVIFVTYCTCDIHFGDATVEYVQGMGSAQHVGLHNAKVVEKWAREHFLNPEVIFVAGSSAGAYGAWFHGPFLREIWPASQMHVFADAGNGVITDDFLCNEFSHWNFLPNLPDVDGVLEAITEEGGMAAYTVAVANAFPNTNWAHYSTLYDGSPGGQSGFYNVMLNDGDPAGTLRWWDASCEFGELALAQSEATFSEVPTNYRYYFGGGSAHTVFRNDKVYDHESGGVPLLVDWIGSMLASGPQRRDPQWTNVLCEGCGVLLDGDPQPTPLEPPFQQRGDQVVVVCE